MADMPCVNRVTVEVYRGYIKTLIVRVFDTAGEMYTAFYGIESADDGDAEFDVDCIAWDIPENYIGAVLQHLKSNAIEIAKFFQ